MSNKKILALGAFVLTLSSFTGTTAVFAATDAGCTTSVKFSSTTGKPCSTYSASASPSTLISGTILSLGQTKTPEGQKFVLAVKAMIESLKASNQKVPPVLKLIVSDYRGLFTKTLTVGSKDSEVKLLQQFLNLNGFLIAKTGIGSMDKETTYFGPATRAALIKFQKSRGISPANGIWGPAMRSAVEAMSK